VAQREQESPNTSVVVVVVVVQQAGHGGTVVLGQAQGRFAIAPGTIIRQLAEACL